ncbi:hypothetical protein Bbelb_312260 [Branchiostoma belcheri]|nr:hypothetical protein Bbelb_312260 [Branchiostoma belcheri]
MAGCQTGTAYSQDVRLLNSPHPQPHEWQDLQAAAAPGGIATTTLAHACAQTLGLTNRAPGGRLPRTGRGKRFGLVFTAGRSRLARRRHREVISAATALSSSAVGVGSSNTPPTGRAGPQLLGGLAIRSFAPRVGHVGVRVGKGRGKPRDSSSALVGRRCPKRYLADKPRMSHVVYRDLSLP